MNFPDRSETISTPEPAANSESLAFAPAIDLEPPANPPLFLKSVQRRTATITDQRTEDSASVPVMTPMPSSDTLTAADNVHQFEALASLGRGTITALAVSPNGATLAIAGSLGVWLYEMETMQTLWLLEGHSKPVTGIAWSPDSTRLASAP